MATEYQAFEVVEGNRIEVLKRGGLCLEGKNSTAGRSRDDLDVADSGSDIRGDDCAGGVGGSGRGVRINIAVLVTRCL